MREAYESFFVDQERFACLAALVKRAGRGAWGEHESRSVVVERWCRIGEYVAVDGFDCRDAFEEQVDACPS